jgi:hypothetical protein
MIVRQDRIWISARQYLCNYQSGIDLTIQRASKFDRIKLIKSRIKTSRSNTTLLPCLNKTTRPDPLQKSEIVCGL